MDILLLQMLEAYDNFGNEIGFTEEELKNLISKYLDVKKLKCNERGYILLWLNKYLSDELFAKYMGIKYEDSKFWMVVSDFSDIIEERVGEILNGEYDWDYDFHNEYTASDIETYYWDDYNEETLKDIIKWCVTHEIELDDVLMTEDNTILKDKDIYFNNKLLRKYLKEDDLDELIIILTNSVGEAYFHSEFDYIYKKLKNEFIDKIGNYKWKTIINSRGKQEDRLYIDLSNYDFNDIEYKLKEQYGEYEFEEGSYGSLYYILKEFEYFDNFREPDYRYLSVSMNDEILNSITSDRLNFD